MSVRRQRSSVTRRLSLGSSCLHKCDKNQHQQSRPINNAKNQTPTTNTNNQHQQPTPTDRRQQQAGIRRGRQALSVKGQSRAKSPVQPLVEVALPAQVGNSFRQLLASTTAINKHQQQPSPTDQRQHQTDGHKTRASSVERQGSVKGEGSHVVSSQCRLACKSPTTTIAKNYRQQLSSTAIVNNQHLQPSPSTNTNNQHQQPLPTHRWIYGKVAKR